MPECDNCNREVKELSPAFRTDTREPVDLCELCERSLLGGGYISFK